MTTTTNTDREALIHTAIDYLVEQAIDYRDPEAREEIVRLIQRVLRGTYTEEIERIIAEYEST